jgi:hypothetical protein
MIDKIKNKTAILADWESILGVSYDFSKTFLENISKVIDPKNLGFSMAKVGDKLPDSREVWTDGKSIMIKKDSDLYSELDVTEIMNNRESEFDKNSEAGRRRIGFKSGSSAKNRGYY